DHGLETAQLNVVHHQVDRAAGKSEMPNHAFFDEPLQCIQRSAGLDDLFESHVFGIVQIADVEVIETQQPQATLDAPTHLFPAEVERCEVSVGFGRNDESARHSAPLADDQAD